MDHNHPQDRPESSHSHRPSSRSLSSRVLPRISSPISGISSLSRNTNPDVRRSSVPDSRLITFKFGSTEAPESTADLRRNQANAYSKMDVLRSRQVDRITFVSLATCGLSLLYTVVICILANTAWYRQRRFRRRDGTVMTVAALHYDLGHGYLELFLDCLASAVILVLAVVYTRRVVRNKKSSFTAEQAWAAIILWSLTLYMLPAIIARIMFVHDFYVLGFKFKRDRFAEAVTVSQWGRTTLKILWNSRLFGSSIASVFYLWGMSHSYGLRDRMKCNRDRLRFYAPKVIPLLIYQVLRLFVSIKFTVFLSQLPFTSLCGMILLFTVVGEWPTQIVVLTVVITLLEFYFIISIAKRAVKTGSFLGRQNYIKTRPKQVGFRFLLAHHFTYYAVMIVIDILIRIFFPSDFAVASYLKTNVIYFSNGIGVVVVDCMSVVNALIIAYVNLPPDSVGIRGWIGKRDEEDDDDDLFDTELLTLAIREKWEFLIRKSNDGAMCWNKTLIVKDYANSCVLPTIVTMFNFSWLVYEWTRYKRWGDAYELTDDCYAITDFVDNDLTDTHMMIITGQDRIVLAFKGTTSMQNVRTDLKMVTSPLLTKFPTSMRVREDLSERIDWRVARVHSGFLNAYESVSNKILDKVKRHLEEQRRPVLLTGHSLGGALATLCSLDLRLSLGLSEYEVSVATFGSPRCGNAAWSHVYGRHVHSNWRFVLKSDIVTNFPPFPYRHVGKQVLISSNGNLFLDPNGLETMMGMSGEMSSMANHRKPAYLLALKAFCHKYLSEEYSPAFWDFEISEDVLEIWEQKCSMPLRSCGETPHLFVGTCIREPSISIH